MAVNMAVNMPVNLPVHSAHFPRTTTNDIALSFGASLRWIHPPVQNWRSHTGGATKPRIHEEHNHARHDDGLPTDTDPSLRSR